MKSNEETICVVCFDDFNDTTHVRCRECAVKHCPECFRTGAVVGRHKKVHNYTVTAKNVQWDKDEDENLINAAQRHTLGNWHDSKMMMNTVHTAVECRQRFRELFVAGPIGKIALNDVKWHKTKDKLRHSGRLKDLHTEDNPLKYNMVLSALRWRTDVTVSPESSTQEQDIQKIVKEFVEFEGPLQSRDVLDVKDEAVRLYLDERLPEVVKLNKQLMHKDPMDPSSDEEDEDVDMNDETEEVFRPELEQSNLGDNEGNSSGFNEIGEMDFTEIMGMMSKIDLYEEEQQSSSRQAEKKECDQKLNSTNAIIQLRCNDPPLSMYAARKGEMPEFDEEQLVPLQFNPMRNEFIQEYFNNAEKLIGGLDLYEIPRTNNEVTNMKNNAKFARLDTYNRVLMKREAMKNAIVEHRMMQQFFDFQKAVAANNSKASELLAQRTRQMKVFERLQSALTCEELIRFREVVKRNEAIEKRIEKLKAPNARGATKLEDIHKDEIKEEKEEIAATSSAEDQRSFKVPYYEESEKILEEEKTWEKSSEKDEEESSETPQISASTIKDALTTASLKDEEFVMPSFIKNLLESRRSEKKEIVETRETPKRESSLPSQKRTPTVAPGEKMETDVSASSDDEMTYDMENGEATPATPIEQMEVVGTPKRALSRLTLKDPPFSEENMEIDALVSSSARDVKSKSSAVHMEENTEALSAPFEEKKEHIVSIFASKDEDEKLEEKGIVSRFLLSPTVAFEEKKETDGPVASYTEDQKHKELSVPLDKEEIVAHTAPKEYVEMNKDILEEADRRAPSTVCAMPEERLEIEAPAASSADDFMAKTIALPFAMEKEPTATLAEKEEGAIVTTAWNKTNMSHSLNDASDASMKKLIEDYEEYFVF